MMVAMTIIPDHYPLEGKEVSAMGPKNPHPGGGNGGPRPWPNPKPGPK